MNDYKKNGLLNTQKIKALIKYKQISRQQIAERLGIKQPTLSAKLNNRFSFNVNEIKILSDILGVSIDYLYTGDL